MPMPIQQPYSSQPAFVQYHFEDRATVRAELQQGLLATTSTTSPKYLYDALGSHFPLIHRGLLFRQTRSLLSD
jgi:uncharacterized SAM-dependent methyltransferase